MPKVLGAAFLVAGVLAWTALASAALPQEDGATPAAGGAGLQLARGGGSGGHGPHTAYAREKAAEKAEAKKEREAVSQAKSGASGDQSDDAGDAADEDDAESGLRPAHHAH